MSEYKSHSCCWEQKQSPACGLKGEHLRCCLCEERNPKFEKLKQDIEAEERALDVLESYPTGDTQETLRRYKQRIDSMKKRLKEFN